MRSAHCLQTFLDYFLLLRAADSFAYIGCGSTAYSVGAVYEGKGHLYTPGVRPTRLTPERGQFSNPLRARKS
jgi:hypothetical protein